MKSVKIMYSKIIHNKFTWIFLLALAFLPLFLAIYTKEYYSDDLYYLLKWMSNEKIADFNDLILFQYNHYLYWGGRTVAHTILQLLFLIGKPISALLTTIVYFTVAFLIQKFSFEKWNMQAFLLTVSLMFFLNPNFEETVLWYTGSANYLWTIMIVLLSIIPFVNYWKNGVFSKGDYFWVLFSFFAGWCNENISVLLIVFMFAGIIDCYIKKKKIAFVMLLAAFSALIGALFLILAPGNFVRNSDFSGGIMSLAYRGHGQVNAWFNWLLPINVLLLLSYYITLKRSFSMELKNKLFLVWGLLSILIMVLAPTYPNRATFGSLILLLIPLFSNIEKIIMEDKEIFLTISFIMIIGFIGTVMSIGILQYVRMLGIYIPG